MQNFFLTSNLNFFEAARVLCWVTWSKRHRSMGWVPLVLVLPRAGQADSKTPRPHKCVFPFWGHPLCPGSRVPRLREQPLERGGALWVQQGKNKALRGFGVTFQHELHLPWMHFLQRDSCPLSVPAFHRWTSPRCGCLCPVGPTMVGMGVKLHTNMWFIEDLLKLRTSVCAVSPLKKDNLCSFTIDCISQLP